MQATDRWELGDPYERYIGRWSRPVAERFVRMLDAPPGIRWLDVGCGTGALTAAILAECAPASVVGIDPSDGFLETARARFARGGAGGGAAAGGAVGGAAVRFERADAAHLPMPDDSVDAVVAGLVLNFVPSPGEAVAEMVRVAVPGGIVAAYVWDYADGMRVIREFWDAAVALDPDAAALDERARFELCRPDALRSLLLDEPGIDPTSVAVSAIDADAVFADFDDYWTPFLGGQGPAPAYAMSLDPSSRDALRERLRAQLPSADDGSIVLGTRAWAVMGRVEGGRVVGVEGGRE